MTDQLADLQRQLDQLRVYIHHVKCVDDGVPPELWAAWRERTAQTDSGEAKKEGRRIMNWNVVVGTNDYGTDYAEDAYDVVETTRKGGDSQVADCGAVRCEGTRERAYLIAAAPIGMQLAKSVMADPLASAKSRRLATRLLKKATPPKKDAGS